MPTFNPAAERDRLAAMLARRKADINRLHNYYDGNHDLPDLPEKCNDDIRRLRDDAMLNLCPLVVDAVGERLEVQGLTFDKGTGTDVWSTIWQANQLDAVSPLVHQEALIARRSFVLVWPEANNGVRITPETPDEFLIDYEPGSHRVRRSAIKQFTEVGEDGTSVGITDVTIWTSTGVWAWRNEGVGTALKPVDERTGPNPLGRVPGVEFMSLPNLRGVPHSELDRGVITVQDRITKTIFDRLVLQEFQAFPQRWATGISVETDAETGLPVNPIIVGPDKVTIQTSKDVTFGQWDAADLKPHLEAVAADIHALAAITKTPVHYLAAEFSNVSADAIRAAEAGLVKKVIAHQRIFGEAWEEVIRLALRATNDSRATDLASFVAWTDPETRTLGEQADAAVKLFGKIPNAEFYKRLGANPQQQAQWPAEVASDSLANRMAAMPIAATVPAGG